MSYVMNNTGFKCSGSVYKKRIGVRGRTGRGRAIQDESWVSLPLPS